MKAKFIGPDGQQRYKKGKVYELVETSKDRIRWADPYIIIQRTTGGGWNTYNTKGLFEKEWDVLEWE